MIFINFRFSMQIHIREGFLLLLLLMVNFSWYGWVELKEEE